MNKPNQTKTERDTETRVVVTRGVEQDGKGWNGQGGPLCSDGWKHRFSIHRRAHPSASEVEIQCCTRETQCFKPVLPQWKKKDLCLKFWIESFLHVSTMLPLVLFSSFSWCLITSIFYWKLPLLLFRNWWCMTSRFIFVKVTCGFPFDVSTPLSLWHAPRTGDTQRCSILLISYFC